MPVPGGREVAVHGVAGRPGVTGADGGHHGVVFGPAAGQMRDGEVQPVQVEVGVQPDDDPGFVTPSVHRGPRLVV